MGHYRLGFWKMGINIQKFGNLWSRSKKNRTKTADVFFWCVRLYFWTRPGSVGLYGVMLNDAGNERNRQDCATVYRMRIYNICIGCEWTGFADAAQRNRTIEPSEATWTNLSVDLFKAAGSAARVLPRRGRNSFTVTRGPLICHPHRHLIVYCN